MHLFKTFIAKRTAIHRTCFYCSVAETSYRVPIAHHLPSSNIRDKCSPSRYIGSQCRVPRFARPGRPPNNRYNWKIIPVRAVCRIERPILCDRRGVEVVGVDHPGWSTGMSRVFWYDMPIKITIDYTRNVTSLSQASAVGNVWSENEFVSLSVIYFRNFHPTHSPAAVQVRNWEPIRVLVFSLLSRALSRHAGYHRDIPRLARPSLSNYCDIGAISRLIRSHPGLHLRPCTVCTID